MVSSPTVEFTTVHESSVFPESTRILTNVKDRLSRIVTERPADDTPGLVEAFLDAISDLSLHEADAATGISYGTISRLRRGEWKRIQPGTARQMRRFMADWTRRSEEETPEDAAYVPGEGEERAGDGGPQMADFERSIRSFAGRHPGLSEQQRKLRIRDALDTQVLAYAKVGEKTPEWLERLQRELDRGEL